MPGRISAPGLEEQGEIQLPTVSESKEAHKSQGQEESHAWHCLANSLCLGPHSTPLDHRLGLGLPESRERLCRRMILLI